MKQFIATIHHLGFYWPSEQAEYAKTVLSIAGSDQETQENLAEVVFDMTNNPVKNPTFLSRSKRSYSTSVGDIVEIENKETKEKSFWLCESSGWFQLRRSEIAYLAAKVEEAAETYGGRWEVGYKGVEAIMARRERQAAKLAGPGAGGHRE